MTEQCPIGKVAPGAVETLLDRAFGADRHGRTAYRLRAGTVAIADLSFALVDGDDALLGSIQCWPVRFAGDDGRDVPLVLVGPVAVEPARQRDGLGRQLMRAALHAADAQGMTTILIGDPEYYGRFFGYDAGRTGGWRLPGPVERRRLLARGPAIPAGDGAIEPRVAVAAD